MGQTDVLKICGICKWVWVWVCVSFHSWIFSDYQTRVGRISAICHTSILYNYFLYLLGLFGLHLFCFCFPLVLLSLLLLLLLFVLVLVVALFAAMSYRYINNNNMPHWLDSGLKTSFSTNGKTFFQLVVVTLVAVVVGSAIYKANAVHGAFQRLFNWLTCCDFGLSSAYFANAIRMLRMFWMIASLWSY